MKKIYLLSAVACMFAFAANAQTAPLITADGWIVENSETLTGSIEPAGSVSPTLIKCVFTGESSNDQWKAQLITPSWKKIGQKGDSFKLSFQVMYEGTGANPRFRIASGKTYPWSADFQQGSGDFNTQIVDEDENAVIYDADFALTAGQFVDYSYDHYIGALGADSIRLEIDYGCEPGTYTFKNIVLEVAGKVVGKWFQEAEQGGQGGGSAIAETAAMKAYFANNALYASEAADVVIYNVNGVAVKSVKNTTCVNVADLKAGLYIAKFGNATVKFVK
jgi:hypothetical protein